MTISSVFSAYRNPGRSVYRQEGMAVSLSPRLAGSLPGYIFTGPPVGLPAGHFGTGHGSRAHAPDEYYVIESGNPAVHGMAEATLSYVKYLYALPNGCPPRRCEAPSLRLPM